MQPARKQHARMLEIALRPAPVAHREVDQARRNFFVGPGQVGHHANPPAGAIEQGCFHEVVAQDLPAERRFAGQDRKPRAFDKGAGPDDGIMPPEIADAPVPEREPRRQHRAV